MRFDHVVKSCTWNEAEGQWHVEILDHASGKTIHETCNVLIGANGLLNSWKYPDDVKGLNSYTGRLVHTARWPDQYDEKQWAKERVAVIGSGATSIQTVPTMQPYVKSMDVFVRTPVWFAELADHSGDNYDCKYCQSVRSEAH